MRLPGARETPSETGSEAGSEAGSGSDRHCLSRASPHTELSSSPRIQLGLNSPAAAWAAANIFFAEIDQTTTTTVATIRHVAFPVRFLQIVRHDPRWIYQFGEMRGEVTQFLLRSHSHIIRQSTVQYFPPRAW